MMFLLSSSLDASPQRLQPKTIPSTFLLKPVTATVDRGGAVELLVRVVGPYGGEVKFEISHPPSFGTIDEGEWVDSNTRRFRYVNRGVLYSEQDSFEFRVKAPNHAWNTYSAKITVRDLPPSIDVKPEALDFGQIPINSTKQLTLVLSNSYGSVFSGRIAIREPWSILGSDSVSIKQRESCRITIQFAPFDARTYTGELKIIPENPAMPLILTSGQGLAPFQILTNKLIVTPDHPEAVITVSNSISTPLTVSGSGDTAHDYPKSVTIPPSGIVELKTQSTRILLDNDERRCFQTRLVAGRYSESLEVSALGPKGRLIIEPSTRGSQLTALVGHPLCVEGVIRNTSAASHSVKLILSDPTQPNSRPASQVINIKEHAIASFSLSWQLQNSLPKALKLQMHEDDKEIASCTWNVLGKSPSINRQVIDSTPTPVAVAAEHSSVRVANSAEKENLVIPKPPRFEERWIGRSLVLSWIYYGSSDPIFEVMEHADKNSLINRTGEEDNPWHKLESVSSRIRKISDGKWEVALPLPMPGIHQYMVRTASSGEKLVASQSVQISWKMFLWPYLRILLLIAGTIFVIRAIRERI